MVPLTLPWALAGGAAALTALVAIYLLHRRHRTRDVSSILLWAAIASPSAGGRTRERVRLPLTFWLEAAALTLLALAVAGPFVPWFHRARPLVIVLDDSLSMRESRERALTFIEQELGRGSHAPIRIMLAGETPRLAGPAAASMREARRQLGSWSCAAPAGDVDSAIALAMQTGGRDALVLVVTDRAPAVALAKGRVRWAAFGRATPNVAFVGAARSSSERDRVTFEVVNFSDAPQSTPFTLSAAGRVLQRGRVELQGRGRRRLETEVPPATGAIEATIAGGATFDDRVILLPERRAPLPVKLDLANARLRELIEPALVASERARVAETGAELVITDRHDPMDGAWRLEVDTRKAASAFIGPFIVDRTHPLTDGVRFDGVVWGAAPLAGGSGKPIVLAGDRVLMAEQGHTVRMAFDVDASNLQRSPAWPALIWNLIEWRTAESPGLRHANVRLGATAIATLAEQARVRAPDGTMRTATPSPAGQLVIAATQPGIWTLQTKRTSSVDAVTSVDAVASAASGAGEAPAPTPNTYRFACNALLPEESDFARAATGNWGGWSTTALELNGYADAAWVLLALTIALLAVQQRVTQ